MRIAELVGTLSYPADLGLEQPMEHCLRQTAIALRLAYLVGVSDQDREATFYLGPLTNAYCHADAAEPATWFGADIGFKGDGFEMLDMSTARAISFLVRRPGSHGSAAGGTKRLVVFPARWQTLPGRRCPVRWPDRTWTWCWRRWPTWLT